MGGGYTASGTADKDKLAKPYLPSGLKLFSLEGAGEVQTPLRLPAHVELGLGDPVFFRHAKAGELCERFKVLYAVSQGRIVGEYATYRGMGSVFYEAGPVVELVGIGTIQSKNGVVSNLHSGSRRSGQDVQPGGQAAASGRVRALFTPIAASEDCLISLDRMQGLVHVDAEARTATVWAGTKLKLLGELLFRQGLAQENLGILMYSPLPAPLVQGRMVRAGPTGIYPRRSSD